MDINIANLISDFVGKKNNSPHKVDSKYFPTIIYRIVRDVQDIVSGLHQKIHDVLEF